MRSAAKLLIRALSFYFQYILQSCYFMTVVMLFHDYESSAYSSRGLQQQGTESWNSGVFINKEAKGHQGNPGIGQQRKIQFRTSPSIFGSHCEWSKNMKLRKEARIKNVCINIHQYSSWHSQQKSNHISSSNASNPMKQLLFSLVRSAQLLNPCSSHVLWNILWQERGEGRFLQQLHCIILLNEIYKGINVEILNYCYLDI